MMDSPPPGPVPLTVRLYLLCSWLLGWGLVLDGLHQRLWGQYLRLGPWSMWVPLAERLGLRPEAVGWLAVVAGTTCLSASFSVTYRRRWGHTLGLLAAAAGLLFLGLGAGLAAACLLLLLLPATRAHFTPAQHTP